MTDKHLQQLLQSASQPQSDADFTKKVMSQLPQTPIRWQVVWAIRLVTITLAAVLFCWITDNSQSSIALWAFNSPSGVPSSIVIGLGIAALTLYFCKQKKVI